MFKAARDTISPSYCESDIGTAFAGFSESFGSSTPREGRGKVSLSSGHFPVAVVQIRTRSTDMKDKDEK